MEGVGSEVIAALHEGTGIRAIFPAGALTTTTTWDDLRDDELLLDTLRSMKHYY